MKIVDVQTKQSPMSEIFNLTKPDKTFNSKKNCSKIVNFSFH